MIDEVVNQLFYFIVMKGGPKISQGRKVGVQHFRIIINLTM